ncbi:hypothetical protein [Aquimarina agarivorans]|uniref:hypothetical protein n=1 Tax=Aquimarina agarivorans TaxID=980584 RepID=UPI0002D96BD6|nr:hypothetical protein [Aquimarina agarivorans]
MKKIILSILVTGSIAAFTTSCREKKPSEKVEDAVESVGDGIEDAADEVEDAVD